MTAITPEIYLRTRLFQSARCQTYRPRMKDECIRIIWFLFFLPEIQENIRWSGKACDIWQCLWPLALLVTLKRPGQLTNQETGFEFINASICSIFTMLWKQQFSKERHIHGTWKQLSLVWISFSSSQFYWEAYFYYFQYKSHHAINSHYWSPFNLVDSNIDGFGSLKCDEKRFFFYWNNVFPHPQECVIDYIYEGIFELEPISRFPGPWERVEINSNLTRSSNKE